MHWTPAVIRSVRQCESSLKNTFCHYSPYMSSTSKQSPRPFLIYLLNYRNKKVSHAEPENWKKYPLMALKTCFFLHFSPEVQKHQAQFQRSKSTFKRLQLSYSMIYQAQLQMVTNYAVQFFDILGTATEWLDRHCIKWKWGPIFLQRQFHWGGTIC